MGSETEADENRTTIHSLAENWTEYDIHFTGVSPTSAKGILFDPKNDDIRLAPEGEDWKKVENQATMTQLLKWNASAFDNDGRLMRVVHPNGQFFGFLYLNIDQNFAGFRVIDEKTIAVLPVRQDRPARIPLGENGLFKTD
jgi:hypothetical protein